MFLESMFLEYIRFEFSHALVSSDESGISSKLCVSGTSHLNGLNKVGHTQLTLSLSPRQACRRKAIFFHCHSLVPI